MMSHPLTAITATGRMHMKNSMEHINQAMALYRSFLEVLNRSLAPWNFSLSARSLEKALAVRMPEMLDSMSALMPAMFCFTRRLAWIMFRRLRLTTMRNVGTSSSITRASRHWMVNMMAMAPTRVTPEMNRSSGPWWASSVMSKSSAVIRLIRWPVRFLS